MGPSRAGNLGCSLVLVLLTPLDGCSTAETRASGSLSLEQILSMHIRALGGQQKIDAIRSLQTSAILNERGTLHPMFVDRRRPKQLRVRMIHSGELVFTEVYTGSSSWEGAPGKENCHPDSAATAATRHAAMIFDDALIHAVHPELRGRVRIGDRDLYQIDAVNDDGSTTSYFVDSLSFLLDRIRNRRRLHPSEPEQLIETVFGDYRPVSGVMYPFRSVERNVETGEPLTVALTLWAEANVPIAGDPYQMPKACA